MESVEVMDSSTQDQSNAQKSKSLWGHAWDTLMKDRMAMISLIIVAAYALLTVLTLTGVVASDWAKEVGPAYAPPSSDYLLGTDIFGRSVLAKALSGLFSVAWADFLAEK